MFRSLLVLFVALTLTPAALGDGPQVSPGVLDGGAGAVNEGGDVRFVTVGTGPMTALEAVATSDGHVINWTSLRGRWGIPAVAYDGSTGGLSHDGSTLVVAQDGYGRCTPTRCIPLRMTSHFKVYKPKTLNQRLAVSLKGDFSFDALSPSGRKLYLIQHVSAQNLNRYLVRVFDLKTETLAPRAVADRTQRGWVMRGMPMARATSTDGRFVYTLYQNPGGFPFVHALDSVRGTAHCIGLPWRGDQSRLNALKLGADGRRLSVASWTGRPLLDVDTGTYRVSVPAGHTRHIPWWPLGAVMALAFLATSLAVARRRGSAGLEPLPE